MPAFTTHRESHGPGSPRNKTFLLGSPENHASTCLHKAKPAIHSRPTYGAAWYHTKHHITACRKLAFFCPGQLAGLPPNNVRTESLKLQFPSLLPAHSSCKQPISSKAQEQCSRKPSRKALATAAHSGLRASHVALAIGLTYPNTNIPGIMGPLHATTLQSSQITKNEEEGLHASQTSNRPTQARTALQQGPGQAGPKRWAAQARQKHLHQTHQSTLTINEAI